MINSTEAYFERSKELKTSQEDEFSKALRWRDHRIMLAILKRQQFERDGTPIPQRINEVLSDFDRNCA
ncbi:MAG: hypothetical protein PHC34_04555 [Candidatus Gastranaerophilales bacterium]|nr:hypothetical protein [Candidatus Gastranaerophilales bacterium]